MSQTAKVTSITPSQKGDDASGKVDIDIVQLVWDGKTYYWESERGKYTLNQEVNVNVTTGANITPA